MKLVSGVFAALVIATMAACGGVESGDASEELGQVSGALSTCSTTCASGATVACSGNACSSVDGQYVQCDGAYQYCPTTPPPPNCSRANTCIFIEGSSCPSAGTYRDCCLNGLPTGSCYCKFDNTWTCTLPPDGP
ncbi:MULTISPECIES: hypothetical protein [unclassified Corallococcus]|uniref:hypothetical protein n=1 Tax=unclassified Corallococcus TaxID=2685029 RepID=UPI001A8FBAED|nr:MULTISPECIES: hypothetical protein [unclassified Corallococcus]MBN9682648.1 hypothetical protein [Corallococcus sp. NCSPR001]WAS85807.1 hypothetical protein O0N60_02270 [Corallococcus sp. NCRR]